MSSNNGQSKRWPIPYWATLIDRLLHENIAQVVLSGAPDDLPLIESVTRRMHEHAVNLAGKTSLTQLAALMERADLLVTGDSGPMHIATAVGTPLIAIHGPTDPVLKAAPSALTQPFSGAISGVAPVTGQKYGRLSFLYYTMYEEHYTKSSVRRCTKKIERQ